MTETSGGSVDAVRLGRAIAAARSERGIKRAQLAVAAEVSYPYLSELENGTKHGTTRKIGQIAEALGLTPSQLLARAEALARGDDLGPSSTTGAGSMVPAREASTGDGEPGPAQDAEDARPVALAPLASLSDRTEDMVVERVTRAVRAEIERWLEAELEVAVRKQVRDVIGGETR